MYTTVEQVKNLTNYDVTTDEIYRAQAIVEAFTGKMESEVEVPNDRGILARATAYQAAYMSSNAETVFEQVSVSQIGQNDSLIMYKAGDDMSPWIAPLAILTLKKLSWRKSRSVRTGRIFGRRHAYRWEAI